MSQVPVVQAALVESGKDKYSANGHNVVGKASNKVGPRFNEAFGIAITYL
jgi:hypothetical protein